MRLTAILLTLACIHAAASGTAQTVTLNEKNAPLERVFEQIKKQTGYTFAYTESLLNKAKAVSINIKNGTLEQVLELCFKDQPFTYSIIEKTVVVKPKPDLSSAGGGGNDRSELTGVDQIPPINIHGRIVNEKGEPVIASVQVKGTNKGTTTNDNGEFELKGVDDNATLVISGVSIETFEVRVNGRSELALEARVKTIQGEEVVVEANTGYQRVKPNEVTGSLVLIDNKKLNEQTSPNILKRLEGVTPGLLFDNNRRRTGSGTATNDNISIRGLSTINASMDPLTVVDGFIYEGSISNINPNDVENITILKDAASASIWGARAGNGVIVISTKKGQFNQKLQVGFSTDIIVGEKPDLHYLKQMSSSAYIDFEQFLFKQGFFSGLIATPSSALTPAVQIFANRQNGLISSTDSASQINALKRIDTRDQYLRYVYTNPITHQYSINLRGGGTNAAYMFSVGYDRSIGELQNRFDKLNIKVENMFRPIKNLLIDMSAYFTDSKSKTGAQPYYGTLSLGGRQGIPYYKIADDNGNPLAVPIVYNGAYTDTAGGGKLLDWKYFPLVDWKHDRTITNLQDINANVGLQYRIIKSLNVEIKYQYEKQQSQGDRLADLESYAARDIINTFSQLNRSTGVMTYIVPKGAIRQLSNGAGSSYTARSQINFNQIWGQHAVTAIVGAEARQIKNEGNQFTEYGYNADPLTYAPVDFANVYPDFIYGSARTIPGAPAFGETIYRYVSMYTNGSYIFKQRYLFSASARKDGSNIFGANANDKWNPLWSIGAGWNISNEHFYKSEFFPVLKLRVTYGYSGNVDPSRSALPVGTYSGNAQYTNFPFIKITVLNNPDLRWEKTAMTNLGLDFAIKNAVITGSIDYYQKQGTDLYGPSLYDYTVWGTSNLVTINSANLKGKGVDLVLNTKNINRNIKWATTFLFNYNTNKVTKYSAATSNSVITEIGTGTSIAPVIGKPLYAIAAYRWGGLDASGNPQGYVNGQKSIDYAAITAEGSLKGVDGNIKYFGPSSPPFFGSLMNSISWKGLTLSGLISYKVGYYFRKNALSYQSLVNFGIGTADFEKRWQNPSDEAFTDIPSFLYPINSAGRRRDNFFGQSSVNVLKGDHIRLQYINLSYSLTKAEIRNLPVNEIQVFINAANLGILWKANKQDIDPEYPTSVPPSRIWTFGIRTNL